METPGKSIMGIDQGLNKCAIVLIEDGKYATSDYYFLPSPKKPITGDRRGKHQKILKLEKFISDKINLYMPDIVSREDYAFSGYRAADMGEVGWGVDRTVLREKGIDAFLTIIPLQSVKSFMVSPADKKNAGDKKNKDSLVLKNVLSLYGVDLANSDLADAFAIAMINWHLVSKEPCKYKWQDEVIRKLRKSDTFGIRCDGNERILQ